MNRKNGTSCHRKKTCTALSETKENAGGFLGGAISRAQFDKSFGDLTEKMGMQEYENH